MWKSFQSMNGVRNIFNQDYLFKDDAFQKIIVEAKKTFLPITKDPIA